MYNQKSVQVLVGIETLPVVRIILEICLTVCAVGYEEGWDNENGVDDDLEYSSSGADGRIVLVEAGLGVDPIQYHLSLSLQIPPAPPAVSVSYRYSNCRYDNLSTNKMADCSHSNQITMSCQIANL